MRSIFRAPSIKRKIMASTTAKYKRQIKKSLLPYYGEKGTGVYKDPKKALYNELYNKSSIGQKDFEKLTNQENVSSNNQVNKEELPYSSDTYKVAAIFILVCSAVLTIMALISLIKIELFGVGYILFFSLFAIIAFFVGKFYLKLSK